EEEVKEIAYHYLRTHFAEKLRPSKVSREEKNGHGEPTWKVELVDRKSGEKAAEIVVGIETGATYEYTTVS
ncbi:MAG TPA: hypothetical protein PKZ32_20155, partial [Candidatus Melainabacteria bacterium]|nr:hypothetical protein [Candidatus Melainabacteria bacterium]